MQRKEMLDFAEETFEQNKNSMSKLYDLDLEGFKVVEEKFEDCFPDINVIEEEIPELVPILKEAYKDGLMTFFGFGRKINVRTDNIALAMNERNSSYTDDEIEHGIPDLYLRQVIQHASLHEMGHDFIFEHYRFAHTPGFKSAPGYEHIWLPSEEAVADLLAFEYFWENEDRLAKCLMRGASIDDLILLKDSTERISELKKEKKVKKEKSYLDTQNIVLSHLEVEYHDLGLKGITRYLDNMINDHFPEYS
ncbi:MAG: hypothetical protein ACLFPQ_04510 [Candidatus Woesearchaeota archaeon]